MFVEGLGANYFYFRMLNCLDVRSEPSLFLFNMFIDLGAKYQLIIFFCRRWNGLDVRRQSLLTIFNNHVNRNDQLATVAKKANK